MPENNQESFDEVQPIVDFQQLELELQCDDDSSEDEEKDIVSEKCRLWTNWYVFIVPARIREIQSKIRNENDSQDSSDSQETQDSQDPYERFVPKTKTGRQIGVMNYVLHEEGNINIEEMLYIDVVLSRIRSFGPQMAGVDRYDDMGIRHFRCDFRHFVEDFFSLSFKKRQKALEDFKEIGAFCSEINQAAKRLENLANIPMAKKTPEKSSGQEKTVRTWPDGLAGRDLELFKLLSGIETMSPRSQALSVLNYILPEESSEASDSQPTPIRLEPGDKNRVAHLLKRFPCLRNRYPYLLKMIEDEIPAEKFNANTDDSEYKYNNFVPFSLSFPSVLEDIQKESANQSWFSNRVVKWGAIIAVLCSLIKLAGILFNALI